MGARTACEHCDGDGYYVPRFALGMEHPCRINCTACNPDCAPSWKVRRRKKVPARWRALVEVA